MSEIPPALSPYPSWARRASDVVTNHILAGNGGRGWVAIAFSDGRSDGVLYDTKEAAMRHQLSEKHYAYLVVPMDSCTPRQAFNAIRLQMQLAEQDMRLIDPARQVMFPESILDGRPRSHGNGSY